MKKLLVICFTFVILACTFTFLSANADDEIISPTAPTYTETTKKGNKPIINIEDIITRVTFPKGGPYTSGPDWNVPSKTPVNTKSWTWNNKDKNNKDKNNENASSDKSQYSPDTNAESHFGSIAVAVVSLIGVTAVACTSAKKKENN